MFLTIFTPTYNRAYRLPALYESLCAQTRQDFEWLIVDDGSTDNTEELVGQWIAQDLVSIRYYKQANAGKSQAHNKGVELTETELFLCVDSDDTLTQNAVEEIYNKWSIVSEKTIGILAYKIDKNTGNSVTLLNDNIQYATLYEAYEHLGLHGDTMLCYKTDIIKKHKFPRFPGEKFVPESYLYDLLDQYGKLAILHKGLYLCEYLEGGYTSNMARLLKNNNLGYLAYIDQRLKLQDKTLKAKFLDSIRYVAMAISSHKKHIVSTSVYPLICALAYLPGALFYYRRYRNV